MKLDTILGGQGDVVVRSETGQDNVSARGALTLMILGKSFARTELGLGLELGLEKRKFTKG